VRKAFALWCSFLILVGVAVSSTSASAQQTPASEPTITLVEQPATVGPGDEFVLRVRLEPADPAGLDVRLVLHDDLNTRSGFEQTVAGAQLGGVVDRAEVDLAGAAMHEGVAALRFGIGDTGLPAEQTLRPDGTGVFPIEVELRRDGAVLDSFVSWLVHIEAGGGDGPIAEPLRVAWVWSVVAPPAFEADGVTPNADVLADMAGGGRLDEIANLLERADEVPLTLELSPETLQSWLALARERRQLRAGANALRVAAGDADNALLLAPYVPIDLPAYLHAGLGPHLSEQLVTGQETLQRLTGARVDSRTALVDPVDAAALARLREFLVDQTLVREEKLLPRDPEPSLTPARPFVLASDDASFTAASTNPLVTEWLEGSEPPALRAQRFLAGLSLIALEAPGRSRGIVVATPRNWSPDRFAVTHVLRGLRDDPLLRPVTLDTYFEQVPLDTFGDPEQPLVRTLAPTDPPTTYPISAFDYANAERSLDSFRSVVGHDDASVRAAERALLVSQSSLLTPARAAQQLAVVDRAAAAFLSQITTTQQRVTLTARRAQIPLTFSNQTGQTVRVRVRLEAPSGKALFPDGAEQVVTLAPGNQTQRFVVEARATGTFAMTVTLTSEDGQLPIGAPTEITVRSTVFSGWGAALTVGALVFLAGWWANHIRRSRRAARLASA
jgi:hypothetical protein